MQLLLVLLVIVPLCWGNWEATLVADLTRDLAHQHNLFCITFLHPGEEEGAVPREVILTVKAAHRDANFHFVRVRTFLEPIGLDDWHQCSNVLYVFLAWLPYAKDRFPQFTEHKVIDEATWLILLPENLTCQQFIGEVTVPFLAHVLTGTRTGVGVDLHETWRVMPGRPLRVVPYATWTTMNGQNCILQGCAFYSRKDLEGAPLRAATKDDVPISGAKFLPNGLQVITGYFGDIYYELAEQLNCTTMVLPNEHNVTGSATDGVWNGLIGMMSRNETDLAVGPISVESAIIDVASFVRPLLRTNYQVFFKQDGTVVEWDAFLKPFGKYVWRLILLWFLVGAFALNMFYRVGVRYGHENRLYSWEFSKFNSFLTFFKAFCQQGCYLMPQSLSCRGLYLTGYLTSTILVTAYSAALISKLTLQEPLRPFDSLESFLEDGSYTLTAIAASTDYTYFSEATDDTLRKIYLRMMKHVPEKHLPMGKEAGLDAVCEKSKLALFITFAVTQITAKEMETSKKCRILHFRNPLGTIFLTIGIRKNMPYSRLIENQLQVMAERGVLQRLQKKEWPLSSFSGSQVAPPEVEIQQVAQIHAVLLVGFLLAILVLLAEIASVTPHFTKIWQWMLERAGITSDTIVTGVFILATLIVLSTILVSI